MVEKQKTGRVLMLPVDCIEPSPYQARTVFDDTEIAALAVSILQNGLLQPVSVRRVGLKRYQLVAGERRLRACRMAKLPRVPAILAEYDEGESAALGLLENIQRSQLDPFDTARGIREVIRVWGCTQAEAARRLGLSQPALANKLRLLSLTQEQQDICTGCHLSERHARAELRLPEGRRTAALEKMAREEMSVREADRLVEELLAGKPEPLPVNRRTMPMVRDVRFFVNTLQHAVDVMTQKGIRATTTCGRRDGCLEYTVRIPVNAAEGAGGDLAAPLPLFAVGAALPGAGARRHPGAAPAPEPEGEKDGRTGDLPGGPPTGTQRAEAGEIAGGRRRDGPNGATDGQTAEPAKEENGQDGGEANGLPDAPACKPAGEPACAPACEQPGEPTLRPAPPAALQGKPPQASTPAAPLTQAPALPPRAAGAQTAVQLPGGRGLPAAGRPPAALPQAAAGLSLAASAPPSGQAGRENPEYGSAPAPAPPPQGGPAALPDPGDPADGEEDIASLVMIPPRRAPAWADARGAAVQNPAVPADGGAGESGGALCTKESAAAALPPADPAAPEACRCPSLPMYGDAAGDDTPLDPAELLAACEGGPARPALAGPYGR